ncbi:MAG: copper homeostasis protein CutC [Saprospiraceae bacterium]|nr:MAG: copper homeostasis protein CutC [Saprospiraceae bacterium]
MKDLLKEACVETLEDALRAQTCGADRIELCANLAVGGLTPDDGLILAAKEALHIPIMVMVRPAPGHFAANAADFEAMERTIYFCKKAGVAGVVFGLLTGQGEVDVPRTTALATLAQPLQVTFHKAVDESAGILKSVAVLKRIPGIHRILTSGGATTALEGAPVLRKMIAAAGVSLTIVVAGRVTQENLETVHRAIGAYEYHGRRIVF